MSLSTDQWIAKAIRTNPTSKFWWDEKNKHYMMECAEWAKLYFPAKYNGFDVVKSGRCIVYFDENNNRHILVHIIVGHQMW